MNKRTKYTSGKRTMVWMAGMLLSAQVFAQDLTVKGHVKDETGEPVIGANILIKGTTEGTISDLDGNFILPGVNPGDTLVISFVGYQPQEIPAAPTLQILLKEDSELLNEVVVIGYGSVKKNDATGSVTALKPDELSKGITTNAQDMLAGKIAGVSVISNDGTPGGGAQIRIRGGSSLNASNDPLIVIDGLAIDNSGIKGMSNGLSMVNPEDIETFTVLKDASATAIYGSRASNGVIIITTKKGKSGQAPKVSYSGSVSVSTTQKRYDVLGGDAYREYASQLWGNSLPATLGTADTDWQDEIFRTAVSTDHHVSINGGFKNLPYRLSLGYSNNNGIIQTSNFQRFTTSLNLAPSFFDDHLKVNLTAKYMNGKNRYANGDALGAALSMDPTRPVYGEGDMYNSFGGYYQNAQATSDFADPDWRYTSNKNTAQNPVAALYQKDDRANSNDFTGNLEVDYKFHFLPDLRLHASIGGEYAEGTQTTLFSPYSFAYNYYGNTSATSEYKYNLSYNVYGQYIKTLGDHTIDIMAGGEEQHFHRNGFTVGNGVDSYTGEIHDAVLKEQTAYATRNTLVSYFGRLNYSLLDRYLLTFTMRWDGSSRFADGNRWGTFPSLALGWKLKEEKFLKDVHALSDLKLRLGWGITGQQDISSDFAYMPLYIVSDDYAQYPFGDEYYHTSRPNAFNTNLKWETTAQFDAGIDFGFFNNRLTVVIDGYYKKTRDLLLKVKVPGSSGFSSGLKNIGEVENKGFELAINATPIEGDFTWNTSLNLTYNKNKVLDLGDVSFIYPSQPGQDETGIHLGRIIQVGQPLGTFYGYVYDGLFSTTDDIASSAQPTAKPGDIRYKDISGPDGVPDGVINDLDRTIIGCAQPKLFGGFNNTFSYKNFDLNVNTIFTIGNDVYNGTRVTMENMQGSTNMFASTMNYWTPDNQNAPLPRPLRSKAVMRVSNQYVENGSYLRFQNITLGYNVPTEFLSFTKYVSGLRVYASLQNFFTITSYSGDNPEVSKYGQDNLGAGYDAFSYPFAKSVLFGLNVKF